MRRFLDIIGVTLLRWEYPCRALPQETRTRRHAVISMQGVGNSSDRRHCLPHEESFGDQFVQAAHPSAGLSCSATLSKGPLDIRSRQAARKHRSSGYGDGMHRSSATRISSSNSILMATG